MRGESRLMRNSYLRLLTLVPVSLVFVALVEPALAQPTSNSSGVIAIDASGPALPPESGYLKMGGRSSNGHEIQVNSRYLTLDGKPWLPVMGEFHFSRYPEKYWEEEILKMKAGGIEIISTYIFWIHHEEVEGQFDWTGQRDLHRFVELCGKHGMYVFARVGPWAHGEVRNGGFPDWVLQKGPTRRNDPAYLSHV
jgi:beta-galactosidase